MGLISNPALRAWLRAPGSLSQRLASLGQNFAVQKISQKRARVNVQERQQVRAAQCLVREVILHVDGQPLVYARSVVALRASFGPWRALRGLGARPLADLLFADRRVCRSRLQAQRLKPTSPNWRAVHRAWTAPSGQMLPTGALWARQSTFVRHGTPLRVQEVFVARLSVKPNQARRPKRC